MLPEEAEKGKIKEYVEIGIPSTSEAATATKKMM